MDLLIDPHEVSADVEKHLSKVIRTRADIILPTFGDDYRTLVAQLIIGNAQTVEHLEACSRRSDEESRFTDHAKCDDLTEFRLVEGRRTAFQEGVGEERSINLWEWLRKIRNGGPRDDLQCTFWFPNNNAGPDVLFALRRRKAPEDLKNAPEAMASLPHQYGTQQHAGGKRKRDSAIAELDYSLVLCAVQVGLSVTQNIPCSWIYNSHVHS